MMLTDIKKNIYWTGVPPWVLIGAVAVLLPLFAFITVENINRQEEKSTRLLLEKGAALIRSFEAGTRTGMMGIHRGSFQLQRLLTETAQQPDIVYLLVADINGKIRAHNDLELVGAAYGTKLDLAAVLQSKTLQWRILNYPDGSNIFEVYRKFEPIGPPHGMMQRSGMMRRRLGTQNEDSREQADQTQIIFVGLDMSSIEEAHSADIRHAVIMGAILLLVGIAGFTLLFFIQGYRTTRASLSQIKAFSDNVVENMPIGLVATDSRRRIAAFNHLAESVLQLSLAEVMGKNAADVLPPELWNQIQTTGNHGDVIEKELDCTVGEGKLVPLEIGAGSFEDENGTFLGHILLFKDLTEIRALRREIAHSQRLASVGRLAAGVAHEIRNPLSSIKGFATYFKERYREIPEDQQTADIMIQEVDRLNRVVSQLLEFARPISVSPKRISLKERIADSLKLIEGRAQEKNIRINSQFSADVDDVVLDPDRINQILLNLYLNAVESMQDNGELSVELRSNEEKKGIEIRVSDTGCGIASADLAKIFDPYFTTKTTGTGLGLAIAHNILEAIGGKISVESRVGRGTTFTLFFSTSGEDKNK
jgi:two-component system sensor histidine kinase HydH